jgi:endo-1,4-beta-mannosidase
MERRILVKDSGYLVGANYWASHAAHRMWENWDTERVEKDLAFAHSIGLNVLRTFFWTPELNPLPGTVETRVLDRFEQFLEICRKNEIRIFPTIFVGHMSGTDWDIPWRQGRDFCADPFMIYWEADLVKKIVGRFKGNKTVAGWILTNELPNYTGPMTAETATVWTRAMYQAVKEADPQALVSTGDGARCEVRTDYDGFRVEWIKDHVDWLGVHLYNYFLYDQGDWDELRKSYHIPCRLRYVDVGKPVLLEEFGLSDLISGREEAAGYYRSVLYSSFANGSCGVLVWCLTDFPLSTEVPYSYQPHELFYGVADTNYKIKPQGRVLAEFSRFVADQRALEYQMAEPKEAIFVPYYMYEDLPHHNIDRLRNYRMLEQTFTLAKMAGLNPDFVRDTKGLDPYRLLLITGGARLKAPEWEEIERWVKSGGTLFYTYTGFKGGVYAPNFESLFGCRQRIRFGQLEQSEDERIRLRFLAAFGGISRDEILEILRGTRKQESAFLPVTAERASVVAEDGQGHPAVVLNELGKGKAILCTYPIEYLLLNRPDANLETELHRLYGAAAAEAGLEIRFEGKHPYVEAVALQNKSESLLVAINHTHQPVSCTMRDRKTDAKIELELERKAVRVYRLENQNWSPIIEQE